MKLEIGVICALTLIASLPSQSKQCIEITTPEKCDTCTPSGTIPSGCTASFVCSPKVGPAPATDCAACAWDCSLNWTFSGPWGVPTWPSGSTYIQQGVGPLKETSAPAQIINDVAETPCSARSKSEICVKAHVTFINIIGTVTVTMCWKLTCPLCQTT